MAKTNTNEKNSKNKKQKTSGRVIFNTCMLVFMAVLFGVMTWRGVWWIKQLSKNLQYAIVDDMPFACYVDDTAPEYELKSRANVYLCSSEIDEDGNGVPLSSGEDYALSLRNDIIFAGNIEHVQLEIMTVMFGSMATLANLIGAIIYWNHNRA